jgi:Ca2+-binding RTX toxin-like protein
VTKTAAALLSVLAALSLAATAVAVTRVGGPGNDTLVGTRNTDDLRGREGNDTLIGKGDNDLLVGGLGRDLLRGGGGHDLADYREATAGVAVDLAREGFVQGQTGENDALRRIESVSGGPEADALRGNGGDNTINGREEDDLLVGRRGSDQIVALTGRDTVRAGAARDEVLAANGVRTFVDCGPGRDRVSADRRDRLRRCERVSH